eukprot:m.115128 g.115128  ORF g.115128 m.115128 type:complete len:335 (-) comp14441_c1_seq2:523-1527(-)
MPLPTISLKSQMLRSKCKVCWGSLPQSTVHWNTTTLPGPKPSRCSTRTVSRLLVRSISSRRTSTRLPSSPLTTPCALGLSTALLVAMSTQTLALIPLRLCHIQCAATSWLLHCASSCDCLTKTRLKCSRSNLFSSTRPRVPSLQETRRVLVSFCVPLRSHRKPARRAQLLHPRPGHPPSSLCHCQHLLLPRLLPPPRTSLPRRPPPQRLLSLMLLASPHRRPILRVELHSVLSFSVCWFFSLAHPPVCVCPNARGLNSCPLFPFVNCLSVTSCACACAFVFMYVVRFESPVCSQQYTQAARRLVHSTKTTKHTHTDHDPHHEIKQTQIQYSSGL